MKRGRDQCILVSFPLDSLALSSLSTLLPLSSLIAHLFPQPSPAQEMHRPRSALTELVSLPNDTDLGVMKALTVYPYSHVLYCQPDASKKIGQASKQACSQILCFSRNFKTNQILFLSYLEFFAV